MFSPKTLRYFGIFTIPQGNSKQHIRTTVYALYFVLAFFPFLPDCCDVMNAPVEFRRRIGPEPRAAGGTRPACHNTFACPDIFELADGDFAIIGSDITNEAGKLEESPRWLARPFPPKSWDGFEHGRACPAERVQGEADIPDGAESSQVFGGAPSLGATRFNPSKPVRRRGRSRSRANSFYPSMCLRTYLSFTR